MDPRYFRCNTPFQMVEAMWESGRSALIRRLPHLGGDCNMDYPREKIVSPYPYQTAKEHYEALMACGPRPMADRPSKAPRPLRPTGTASIAAIRMARTRPNLSASAAGPAGRAVAGGGNLARPTRPQRYRAPHPRASALACPDALPRDGGQLQAVERLLLPAGRFQPLVGRALKRPTSS